MGLLSFEHSPLAYRSDFIAYGLAVAALGASLVLDTPAGAAVASIAGVAAGLLLWTALEYALHRWVLHGLEPFRHWHAQHHQRPQARIGSHTLISAALFAGLIYLPAAWLAGLPDAPHWGPAPARALTLGVIAGYLLYSLLHHALHHGPSGPAWLRERRRWHAWHHQGWHHLGPLLAGQPVRDRTEPPAICFGVTSGFWDRVLGSVRSRTDTDRVGP